MPASTQPAILRDNSRTLVPLPSTGRDRFKGLFAFLSEQEVPDEGDRRHSDEIVKQKERRKDELLGMILRLKVEISDCGYLCMIISYRE